MKIFGIRVEREHSFDAGRGLWLPGEGRAEYIQRLQQRSGYFDPRKKPLIMGGSVNAGYRLVSGTPFSAATGAKTFMMAIAPAGHGLALTEFALSMDGVTSTAVPALVELVHSTQAGAGTSGVTPTITQVRGRATSGSAPTGGGNYTAEPTTLTSISRWYVPQFMGLFVYQLPLGREIECDSSGGAVKGIGIRITTSATVNVVGHMEVEAIG